ncbi:MAG TPA: hypothetical protein VHS59_11595 [Bacillota bacterium]|nr:hypothetical protein [Bacillota bacterium]
MTALVVTLLSISVAALKIVLFACIVAGSVVAANKYFYGEEALNLDLIFKRKAVITCAGCHQQLKGSFSFCPHCGSAVQAQTAEVKTQEQLEILA